MTSEPQTQRIFFEPLRLETGASPASAPILFLPELKSINLASLSKSLRLRPDIRNNAPSSRSTPDAAASPTGGNVEPLN